jgi:hypothetical protein
MATAIRASLDRDELRLEAATRTLTAISAACAAAVHMVPVATALRARHCSEIRTKHDVTRTPKAGRFDLEPLSLGRALFRFYSNGVLFS